MGFGSYSHTSLPAFTTFTLPFASRHFCSSTLAHLVPSGSCAPNPEPGAPWARTLSRPSVHWPWPPPKVPAGAFSAPAVPVEHRSPPRQLAGPIPGSSYLALWARGGRTVHYAILSRVRLSPLAQRGRRLCDPVSSDPTHLSRFAHELQCRGVAASLQHPRLLRGGADGLVHLDLPTQYEY